MTPMMILIALLAAYGAFGSLGAMHAQALQIAGLCVMAVGIGVRTTAIAQLGRFHTANVAVRADHKLRENGLCGLVRHPSYLGALITFSGFGLALGNWLAFIVIMGAAPCMYLVRIGEEEAARAAPCNLCAGEDRAQPRHVVMPLSVRLGRLPGASRCHSTRIKCRGSRPAARSSR